MYQIILSLFLLF